jgi:uncharacterized membrane protein YozB (DUF420 family)
MSRRVAWFLIALCGWTLYVWISRLFIMAGQKGNSAGFIVVHTTLALISIAFGLVAGVIGYKRLRAGNTETQPRVDA